MLKRKEAWAPLKDSSSKIYRIGPPFAFLCPVAGMVPKSGVVQLFPTSLAAVSRQESGHIIASTIFQTECLMAWEVAVCTAKASFSSSESLREATVTTLSSAMRETALYDLPLNLGLLDSYCSSLTISGWTHKTLQIFHYWNEALGFLFFCYWVDDVQSDFRKWGQSISDSRLREVPEIEVTMLAVTFFYSTWESEF